MFWCRLPKTRKQVQVNYWLSQSSVFRLLHKRKLYRDHFRSVQQLMAQDPLEDFGSRSFFVSNSPTFYKIVFTDESTFTRRSVFN